MIVRACAAAVVGFALLVTAGCRRDGSAPADGRTAVWIDLSPSYGDPARDPGDALALLQAYGSGVLSVRGVSVTYGNVPLVRGYPVAHELMKRIDSGLLRPWRGASTPEERAAPTEATELLEEALSQQPLTILALGPVTTVASVLQRQPGLAARIDRIVLVGGRAAGAPPGVSPGSSSSTSHLDEDREGLRTLLDTPVDITLVAPDLASGLGFDAGDLDRLEDARGPIRLVLPSARAWLQAETDGAGTTAFAVPALLAVDVAAHPGSIRCEPAVATLPTAPGEPAVIVSGEPGATGRQVTWCHTADAGARDRIIADLMRLGPLH